MYFVTNEPLLFSDETGFLWGIVGPDKNSVKYGAAMRALTDEAVVYVYTGTEQQCEDFILSIAGWLGAVNPEVKKEAQKVYSFRRDIHYPTDKIIDRSFSHNEPAEHEGVIYFVAQAHDGREYWFVDGEHGWGWMVAHIKETERGGGVPTSGAANKLAMRGEGEPNDKREILADYAHAAWAGWMEYLFSKCDFGHRSDRMGEGALIIPEEFVERWQRKMKTPYAELTEGEKQSGRWEADKILDILSIVEGGE